MWVQKIVYITNGEQNHNGLTNSATSQLRKIVSNVLEWENKKFLKVFRATENGPSSVKDDLLYLFHKTTKIIEDNSENLYHNLLSNPWDIKEIVSSTTQWEVVVIGTTIKNLIEILNELWVKWYNVADKDKINHSYNIYAVTIYPNKKEESGFFVAPYGQ